MKRLLSVAITIALSALAGSVMTRATQAPFPGVPHGMWLPQAGDESYSISGSNFRLNASGARVGTVFRAPKTGTLTRFECNIQAVTNALDNGAKWSFQSVSGAGAPSGTILGATNNAFVSPGANLPSATGWYSPGDFGETVSVTVGDVLAAVVEQVSFTAADDLRFGETNRSGDTGMPYGFFSTASLASSSLMLCGLRYNDGTYEQLDDETPPALTKTDFDFDNGTTIRQAGLRFKLPFDCTISRIKFFGYSTAGGGGDWEVHLTDASHVDIMTAITQDGDHTSSVTGGRWYEYPFAPVSLSRNTAYYVMLKPTTTVNMHVIYDSFNSMELMQAVPPGTVEWYATSGTVTPTWTDYNTGGNTYRRPRINLYINSVDDGAGSGSGFVPFITLFTKPLEWLRDAA